MSDAMMELQEQRNQELGWEETKAKHKEWCKAHEDEMDRKIAAIDPNDQYDDLADNESGEVRDQEHFDCHGN
jgi:hypothetical protein